jgi:outer membrane lipopolysaccharide assembly protein LptE/RlpB
MNTHSVRIMVLLVGLALCLGGCGYTFQGGGTVLPPDVRRVSIPLVENNSPEAGLSAVVTEALRDQFERYGVLTVVEDGSEADAILRTRIVKVIRESRTSTSETDTALQFDTVLTLAAELQRVTGPVLWRDNNIQVSRAFGSTSGVVVTSSADFAAGSIGGSDLGSLESREVARGQEQDALRALAEQAARQIYDEAVAPDF